MNNKVDFFKKKSLKFTGYSKELQINKLEEIRKASRLKRLSSVRDFGELENEEHKASAKADKKTGIPSRSEMLKRWKEEKLMKQKKEQLNKKPVFKVGVIPKNRTLDSNISANKSNGSFSKISKPHASTNSTQTCSVNSKTIRSLKLPSIINASSLKPPHISVKSSIQKPKLTTSGQFTASSLKSAPSHSKQIPSTISTGKTKDQSSKPSSLRKEVQLSKLPVTTTKQFQKPTNIKYGISKGIQSKIAKEATGVPKKYANQPKPSNKETAAKKNYLPNEDESLFPCDISRITLDESVRKSFAPSNFLFCPPSALSDFSYCNPSLFFSDVKNQHTQRTSSPLKLSEETSSVPSPTNNDSTQCLLKVMIDVPSGSNISKKENNDIFPNDKQNKTEDDIVEQSKTENFLAEEKQNKTLDIFIEEKQSEIKDVFAEENEIEAVSVEKENIIDLETEEPKEISSLFANSTQSPCTSKPITVVEEINNSFNIVLDLQKIENTTSVIKNGLNKTSPEKQSVPNSPVEAETSILLSSTSFIKNNVKEEADHLNESSDCSINDVLSLGESLKSFQFHESSSETTTSKNFKKLVKPGLESINEIESKSSNTTPKSCRKKKTDENLTPRRSARLSQKLRKSNSFESVFDVEKTPKEIKDSEVLKPKNAEQIVKKSDFAINPRKANREKFSLRKESLIRNFGCARRSTRLSDKLSSSFESLHDVARPSIMGSLDMEDSPEESSRISHNNLLYDFDELHLEDVPQPKKVENPGIKNRVSLLYTPQRPSTRYSSIKGDLMSFSPS